MKPEQTRHNKASNSKNPILNGEGCNKTGGSLTTLPAIVNGATTLVASYLVTLILPATRSWRIYSEVLKPYHERSSHL
ncbi:hypothetical protein SAMN05216308_10251 [Nitrosospira sp. Nsp13]|jgi:hypothetical protein|nr:hypothetical protein SAMN05216308_10251 [Nitrosospira sp. Nsp13]